MMQVFFPKENTRLSLPKNLFSEYKYISSDPAIHAGWPHIKSTRILASDILRAQIQGYSLDTMILQFKEMGISVTKGALIEACKFTIEWMHILNEKESSKATK